MRIELLWLIPVISFAFFIFLVIRFVQKGLERRSKERAMQNEVALFNAGHDVQKLVRAERNDERLHELEKAINMVAEVLARQQRSLQDIHQENNPKESEINELKEKLRTVFKEYDIVLSENYALRARVKQLTGERQSAPAAEPAASIDSYLTTPTPPRRKNLAQYDDTRLINLATMDADDMSESSDDKPR